MPDKILLVDDDPALLDTLAFNLRHAGYRIATASNGAAALERAQA